MVLIELPLAQDKQIASFDSEHLSIIQKFTLSVVYRMNHISLRNLLKGEIALALKGSQNINKDPGRLGKPGRNLIDPLAIVITLISQHKSMYIQNISHLENNNFKGNDLDCALNQETRIWNNSSYMRSSMNIMPIDGIDDFEMRLKRQDAFWDREIIDRACVNMVFPAQEPVCALPQKQHESHEARWMDIEFQAEKALAEVKNMVYMGDALPNRWPDLGPDFLPSLYGGKITFEQDTSYIKPFLDAWPEDPTILAPSREHPYWAKMEELYAAFLEIGKHAFYTGIPDLHPGADCLVGIRGPQNMAMDLFDQPDAVKAALKVIDGDFAGVYDHYYEKLRAAGQAVTGWAGVVSTRKWHVPSNDFSFMISPSQFDEFFLEGLRNEINYFEATLHHLDGPGCLSHIDSLLGIEKLNAIQWVWGAGNGTVVDWLDVFKKVQAAGKGVQLLQVHPGDLDTIMENLRPEGVWMNLVGVESRDEGDALLKKIETWR